MLACLLEKTHARSITLEHAAATACYSSLRVLERFLLIKSLINDLYVPFDAHDVPDSDVANNCCKKTQNSVETFSNRLRRVASTVTRRRCPSVRPSVRNDVSLSAGARHGAVGGALDAHVEHGGAVRVRELHQRGGPRDHADRDHPDDRRVQLGHARPGLGAERVRHRLHEQHGE